MASRSARRCRGSSGSGSWARAPARRRRQPPARAERAAAARAARRCSGSWSSCSSRSSCPCRSAETITGEEPPAPDGRRRRRTREGRAVRDAHRARSAAAWRGCAARCPSPSCARATRSTSAPSSASRTPSSRARSSSWATEPYYERASMGMERYETIVDPARRGGVPRARARARAASWSSSRRRRRASTCGTPTCPRTASCSSAARRRACPRARRRRRPGRRDPHVRHQPLVPRDGRRRHRHGRVDAPPLRLRAAPRLDARRQRGDRPHSRREYRTCRYAKRNRCNRNPVGPCVRIVDPNGRQRA